MFAGYRTLAQTRDVAVVHPSGGRAMSRAERLERWADALERRGGKVRALRAMEFVPWREARAMRADGSALRRLCRSRSAHGRAAG